MTITDLAASVRAAEDAEHEERWWAAKMDTLRDLCVDVVVTGRAPSIDVALDLLRAHVDVPFHVGAAVAVESFKRRYPWSVVQADSNRGSA